MTYMRGVYITMYALYVDLLQLFPTYYVGVWRECSVRGGIYSLRETRSIPSKSQKVDAECNILQDGTLIDLCGATLVWRSRTGQYLPLAAVPSPHPTPLIGHSHPWNWNSQKYSVKSYQWWSTPENAKIMHCERISNCNVIVVWFLI